VPVIRLPAQGIVASGDEGEHVEKIKLPAGKKKKIKGTSRQGGGETVTSPRRFLEKSYNRSNGDAGPQENHTSYGLIVCWGSRLLRTP